MTGTVTTLYCSLCGNSQYEVRRLIRATDQLAVCDECVNLLVVILREEGIDLPFEPSNFRREPDFGAILETIRRRKPS